MKKLVKPLLRGACCLALLATNTNVFAQQTIPLVNSKELVEKGVKFFDKGEYKKALAQYQQVPEGDTNYILAVNESVLTYLADSSFTKAKTMSQEMLALPGSPYKRSFLLYLGHAYDYLGKTDSAIATYDRLITLNPYDHQPYFEKATTYLRLKRYDKAEECFRHSLVLNPYHYRSHYGLGTILLLQGRLSEAYLALATSLFTTNDIATAKGAILLLSEIGSQTDEVANAYRDRKKDLTPAAYEEIDQIINSKLPLSTEYTFESALAGDKIINVLHAIMEKLRYDATEKSLVMQYYVPLYTRVFKNNSFDQFVILMFSGFDIEKVDKLMKKKKEDVTEMRKYVFDYLDKISGTQMLDNTLRKTAPIRYAYLPTSKIFVAGNVKSRDPLEMYEGPAKLYREGLIAAEGAYDAAGKKTGEWTYYANDGSRKSVEHYTGGEYVGSNVFFYPNGNIKEAYLFDDHHKQLEEKDYNYNGDLTSITSTLVGDERKVVLYHPNGSKEFSGVSIKGDLKDGHYEYRYDDGTLRKELSVLNGKTDGVYKEYYRNGQVSEVSHYKNGKQDGGYKSYHRNGKLYYNCTYKDDELEGPLEEYNSDGHLVEKMTLHLGKRNGADSLFTPQGRNYGVVSYKAGAPYATLFTDDDGKMKTASEEGGLKVMITYHPNGNKRSEVGYKNGKAHGTATYYHASGTVKRVANYKDGKLNGIAKDYYRNGNLSEEINMMDDAQDGYYTAFHANGKLKVKGWMKKDKKQGVWRNYSCTGKLARESHYLDNELQGPSHVYNEMGRKWYTDVYDKSMLFGLIEYDTTGKERARTYYPQGNGLYRMTGVNGKPYFTAQLLHGDYHGQYTKQLPNGMVTERGYFKCGKRDSILETYSPTGRLIVKSYYKNGQRNGKLILYDEEGTIGREQEFLDGALHGKDKIYDNGILRYEGNYVNDDREGVQVVYGDNNKPLCLLNYEAGELFSYSATGKDGTLQPATKVKNSTCTITAYYPNEKKALVAQYTNNIFDGKQLIYYSNGQLAEERSYSKSDLNGPVKKWLPNGKPSYEASYVHDEFTGKTLTYDSKGNLVAAVSYAPGGVLHGPAVYTNPKSKKSVVVQYNYGAAISVK